VGQEIERKFLINLEKWQNANKSAGERYRQGYLFLDPLKTVRVRTTETKGFLTIKGPTTGATRLEYEYEIPMAEATELLNNFAVSELSKIRYKLLYKNKIWEIDEFLGDNVGLFVAEIELKSEDEQFDIPEWAEQEVTGEKKYYNSSLTTYPYTKWNS
jgi:adenylate cyclase